MPFLIRIRSLLQNIFSSHRLDTDLEREVQSHLEMLVEETIRAGMSQDEAQRFARIELGGIQQVKEQVREERTGSWFLSVISDCRFGLRQLHKSPGFTAVAVLTLALGIGATTAIFSIIDGALLNPYPYKNADRLATFVVFSSDQFRAWRFPAAAFVDFKQQNQTFEDMFGLVYREVLLPRNQGAESLSGGMVTPGTFESLGIPPLLGRSLTAEDAKPTASPVFVISYNLWTKVFHRDPNILGSSYSLNSTRMTLVGIMPPRFQIGGTDLWLPFDVTRDSFVPGAGIVSNEIWTVGHLKPGINPHTAAADLQRIAAPFEKVDPIYFPHHFKIVVNTFNSNAVAGDFKVGLFALFAAVTMLLLIACGNVANLLLARATTRGKEFGIRFALGASRGRLVRQLLVENFLLASASCALGCLFAYLVLNAMVAVLPADAIPLEAVLTLNSSVLIFSLAVTVFIAFACGLAPAIHVFRAEAQNALASAGKGIGAGFRHGKLRSALVIAEVSLSIILSICSGLIVRSLFALENVSIGFNPSKVVYADIAWPEGKYDRARQKDLLLRTVLDRISEFPGVSAATESSSFPPHTFGWTTVVIAGKTPPQDRNTASIFCSEGYFQTLNRPLLRGTLFTQKDIDSARRVVVVNQAFVRNRFGEDNPIGHQVRFSDYETWSDWPHSPYFEIIGVVTDAKNAGLKDAPEPEIYLPASLTAAVPRGIMVSTTANSSTVLHQIRTEISAVDPNVAVGETGTIAALLQHDYFARPRFLLTTLCTFAAIALLLVAIGVFSVISYTAALQTHEIGIRMALGALPTQVLSLVLKKGMCLILAGIAIGLFASYFLTRLLASQVWGVSTTDPSTFAAVASLALLVGLLACLFPARRASLVDPMVALRYE
jgi:predicted permease